MKTFIKVKFILTMSLFSLINFNSISQEGLHIGMQASPQISWLINRDDMNNTVFTYKTTYTGAFGLVFQYGFTNNSGIGMNVMYSYQGQRYTFEGNEYYKQVDYLKIPLLYVFNYEVYPNILFIGKVGPQAGILLNAKLVDKNRNDIVPDQTQAYENFDIGGTAIGGFGFKIDENLFVDVALRYDYSFTDAESRGYQYNINHPVAINGNGGNNIRSPYRAVTNNSTAGINFGVRYIFKIKKVKYKSKF